MKKVNLSLGQTNVAKNAIGIVFELDSKKNKNAAEIKMQDVCTAYLLTLGILNENGEVIFQKLPEEIMEAIEVYM